MQLDSRLLWFLPAVIVYIIIWVAAVIDDRRGGNDGSKWIVANLIFAALICLILGIKSYL